MTTLHAMIDFGISLVGAGIVQLLFHKHLKRAEAALKNVQTIPTKLSVPDDKPLPHGTARYTIDGALRFQGDCEAALTVRQQCLNHRVIGYHRLELDGKPIREDVVHKESA